MLSGYQIVSAEEDKNRGLLPDGVYVAFLDDMQLKVSAKNGNKYLALKLTVIDQNNRERKVNDWVFIEGDMAWKMRHLADSCNVLDKYENGTIQDNDIYKKRLLIKLVIKDDKDQNGNPIRRNSVIDYVKEQPVVAPAVNDFEDDKDLPF